MGVGKREAQREGEGERRGTESGGKKEIETEGEWKEREGERD